MGTLSKQLQNGKAGEHLVVADLILQGFSAFLSDQGLPYDAVVETDSGLRRIQVKSLSRLLEVPGQGRIYRFGTRHGRSSKQKPGECDYYAFVALDIRQIAYFPISLMLTREGSLKQTVDLKSRHIIYSGRVYSTGRTRTPEWGRYLQDFSRFIP